MKQGSARDAGWKRELAERSSRIRVSAEGLEPQRLLTDCLKRDIPLRKVRKISDTELRMELPEVCLERLKGVGGNCWRFTVLRKRGPGPALLRLLRRPAAIMGILLLLTILWYQTTFVSEIRITGCETITEQDLRQTLQQKGLFEGSRKKNLDLNKLKLALYSHYEDLAWVGIRYQGGLAEVEIAESDPGAAKIGPAGSGTGHDFGTPVPGTPEGGALGPAHIVAEKAGTITRVFPLEGEETVAAGDFVRAGDLLITGILPITDSTYETDRPSERYVRAEGQVYAIIPYRFTFTLDRYVVEPVASGKTASQTTYTLRERTEEELNTLSEARIRRLIKENIPERAEIKKKDLNFVQEENIIKVIAFVEAEEEIGIHKGFTPGFPPADGGEERMN